MIFDLARDFAAALAAMPEAHPRRRILSLLDEAIRRDVHFIDRHPTTLFQCLWNMCAWPPTSDLHQAILVHWRAEREAEANSPPWLRSLRPPAQPLGSGQHLVFRLPEIDRTGSLWANFSADGRFVISSECSAGGRVIRFWDSSTGAELSTLAIAYSYALAPDQRVAAWAEHTFDIILQDTLSGTRLGVLRGHQSLVDRIVYSPDRQRLASASLDGTVRLWDLTSHSEVACLGFRDALGVDLAFSPDGTQLAMASPGHLTLADARSGGEIKRFRVGPDVSVPTVRFSPDGRRLLISGVESGGRGVVQLYNSDSGELIVSLNQGANCFSPDGGQVAAIGLLEMMIRILDPVDGRELITFSTRSAGVHALAFSPSGRWLASAESDGAIRVRDAALGTVLGAGYSPDAGPDGVAFSPDGRQLVSASRSDRTVRVWEMASLHADPGRAPDNHRASAVWFAAGGKHLVVHSAQSLRLVAAPTGRLVATLMDDPEQLRCLTVSPDGRRVSAVNSVGGAHVWDARSGIEVANFPALGATPTVAAFAPDGKWLAHGAKDGSVAIHDVDTGDPIRTFAGHRRAVSCLAFPPNGTHLATGSTDGTTCVWDLSGPEAVRLFESKGMTIFHLGMLCVAFSPDLQHLAAAGVADIRVWEVSGWTEVARLPVDGLIVDLRFGLDGTLVSHAERPNEDAWTMPDDPSTLVGESGVVHVWDIRSGECLERLAGRADFGGIAERGSPHRFLVRSDQQEALIGSHDDRRRLASCPVSFERVKVDQTGPTVAGVADGRLYVFALESST